MNKIVAAFDGLRFSESTLRQAISLSRDRKAHLVGVFLYEHYSAGYVFAENIVVEATHGKEIREAVRKEEVETFHQSIAQFKDACEAAGLEFSIHAKKETAAQDLVEESHFADLMIVDSRDSFSSLEAAVPGWFVHALLREAHCPVLVVGKKPKPFHIPIFLYDGKPSSIYAMKMFTYLFPEFQDAMVEIVTLKPDTLNLHVPHHKLVHEWTKRHYPKAQFKAFSGSVDQLIEVLQEKDSVIITGAYERSRLSMFFRSSLADELMSRVRAPLFIAHT